jgi:hypothetical protein
VFSGREDEFVFTGFNPSRSHNAEIVGHSQFRRDGRKQSPVIPPQNFLGALPDHFAGGAVDQEKSAIAIFYVDCIRRAFYDGIQQR